MEVLIDLKISGYRQLELSADKKSYTLAVTFGNVPLIILCKVEKPHYKMVEKCIENIIEHETLHILIADFLKKNDSHWLERVHGVEGWIGKAKAL